MELDKIPLQPIDKWYSAFLREMKRQRGVDGWHRLLAEAPKEIQEAWLKVHQAATLAYMEKRKKTT